MKKLYEWFCEVGIWVFLMIALLIALFIPFPSEEPVVEELPEVTTDNYSYNVPLSSELQLYITNLCEDYNVPVELILAMIKVESGYQADIIGDGGDSIGLMQIQPAWWGERMAELGVTDLTNPYENVTLGIDLMATYLRSGLGIEWSLMAYNGSTKYANEMVAQGKVSTYAREVMAEAYKLNWERNYDENFKFI